MKAHRTQLLACLIVLAVPLAHADYPQQRRQPGNQPPGAGEGAVPVERLRQLGIEPRMNIPYAGDDNPRHRLDLYLPANREGGKLPVIVFVHGGGWARGDKAGGARRLVPFVRSGNYAGVSVGYRLSGEAKWPAQIHDVKAAIRFIRANADEYGLDPERIGVWGTSAGGHLVLMLGFTGDVPELEGEIGPHADVSSRVSCVANFYGIADMTGMLQAPGDNGRGRADSPASALLGGPSADHRELARQASPITWISEDDPPVLSVHGDADRTVPYAQSALVDKALERAAVTSYFVTVRGGGHGDFGDAAAQPLRQFFSKYLLGSEERVSEAAVDKPGAAQGAPGQPPAPRGNR